LSFYPLTSIITYSGITINPAWEVVSRGIVRTYKKASTDISDTRSNVCQCAMLQVLI